MSIGATILQNVTNSISFRKAVQIEHEHGIPLAKTYRDFGGAFGGKLLLLYEPPYAAENILGLAVVCKVNGTTVEFAGGLESKYPGEPFTPTDELINTVRDSVKQMGVDVGDSDPSTLSYVMEEILNYCVVNVPVKQVYEAIRLEYPKEYRVWSLNYKRRYSKTIEEDMDALRSKQKESHRYGSANGMIKTALKPTLKKNDIVYIDPDKMEYLRTRNVDLYNKIQNQLSEIRSIKQKYIVYNDPVKDTVKLVGKNKKDPRKMSRTEGDIPVSVLNIFEEEADDDGDLHWMTPEDQAFFGIEEKGGHGATQGQEGQQGAPTQQNAPKQKKQSIPVNRVKLNSFGIPDTVYTDKNVAAQYADQIQKVYKWYISKGYKINDQKFIALVESSYTPAAQ